MTRSAARKKKRKNFIPLEAGRDQREPARLLCGNEYTLVEAMLFSKAIAASNGIHYILCPREESNPYCEIRNLASYPLNDEGNLLR